MAKQALKLQRQQACPDDTGRTGLPGQQQSCPNEFVQAGGRACPDDNSWTGLG